MTADEAKDEAAIMLLLTAFIEQKKVDGRPLEAALISLVQQQIEKLQKEADSMQAEIHSLQLQVDEHRDT